MMEAVSVTVTASVAAAAGIGWRIGPSRLKQLHSMRISSTAPLQDVNDTTSTPAQVSTFVSYYIATLLRFYTRTTGRIILNGLPG